VKSRVVRVVLIMRGGTSGRMRDHGCPSIDQGKGKATLARRARKIERRQRERDHQSRKDTKQGEGKYTHPIRPKEMPKTRGREAPSVSTSEGLEKGKG
jgi:hypothetical protein